MNKSYQKILSLGCGCFLSAVSYATLGELSDNPFPVQTRGSISGKSRRRGALQKSTEWTQEEDALLIELCKEGQRKGLNYTIIAPYFPGKTPQQCCQRWDRMLNPTLVKGSWTPAEDQIIIDFVGQNGPKKWDQLAKQLLPGRNGKQCRERWLNQLDPNIRRDPWTQEEINVLVETVKSLGTKWTQIAGIILPGRTENDCKNKWNIIKRRTHVDSQGNLEFIDLSCKPQPASLRPLPSFTIDAPLSPPRPLSPFFTPSEPMDSFSVDPDPTILQDDKFSLSEPDLFWPKNHNSDIFDLFQDLP
ncbi:MAG: hypothetical protein LBR92_00930 [Puniceicoccales bacterium]|jgi:hypothetical protein|nr:hypothetical protein [Puniceicoccales bacterium]